MEKVVTNLKEFEAEAEAFARGLVPNPRSATLVTLSGELGAGKTAFTKAVAKTFGVTETVTSPTFVLEKVYFLESAPFTRLVHIDAYRLESGKDLDALDFATIMKDPETLILLEWPERVSDALPKENVHLSFMAHEDTSRTISYA